jgi:phage antirepressor YoqD-like protein
MFFKSKSKMNENAILKTFNYEGNAVTFESGDGVMVNATQMAKQFGKLPNDWLRLPGTQEFIAELTNVRKSRNAEFQAVITKKGGLDPSKGGTWLHEDAALEFARWLSPKFAIWCNDRIKELITQGYTEMNALVTPENMLQVSKALLLVHEELQSAKKEIAAAERVIDRQRAEIDDKQQMIDAAVEEIQERDEKIDKMQPFAEYAENVLQSAKDYTFTQVAIDLGFRSVYKFQEWAKARGIIYRQGDQWLPKANWAGRGWFGSRTFNKLGENRKVLTRVSTTITERGRAALHFFLHNSRRPSEAELNKINGVNE